MTTITTKRKQRIAEARKVKAKTRNKKIAAVTAARNNHCIASGKRQGRGMQY
ncbi:hypothetical protein QTG56_08810 [Rossellomorea sp. AcN35-11]|nr:hypothetical protein QTG56_08810 [Rossellomorea sp. AcN35-11]